MSTVNASHDSLDRTLGELVAERPARARILERWGIDYCCHGQRTLADAAASAGLDPDEELPLLVALAAKVRDVHGARHPELARIAELVNEIQADLTPHLAKEEQVLFPAIREWADGQRTFPFGTLSNPVRMMMFEHDQAGELLAELRSVTGDYTPPPDGCTSYEVLFARLAHLELDTHRHIHLENNVLFPAVTAGEQ